MVSTFIFHSLDISDLNHRVMVIDVTYSLLVDDLNNSGQLGVVNQDNTAQLDVSPVNFLDGDRHLDD